MIDFKLKHVRTSIAQIWYKDWFQTWIPTRHIPWQQFNHNFLFPSSTVKTKIFSQLAEWSSQLSQSLPWFVVRYYFLTFFFVFNATVTSLVCCLILLSSLVCCLILLSCFFLCLIMLLLLPWFVVWYYYLPWFVVWYYYLAFFFVL